MVLLSHKYVKAVLRRAKINRAVIYDVIDHGTVTYKELIFGNKHFDMDDAENTIINGVRYAGLYESIFKKIPNNSLYTKDNKHKSMMLMTRTNTNIHH